MNNRDDSKKLNADWKTSVRKDTQSFHLYKILEKYELINSHRKYISACLEARWGSGNRG